VTPERRAAVVAACVALPPALVLGLLGLVGGPIVAVVVLVVVAAAVAAWAWWGAERRIGSMLGARPATPAGEARLLNLVEGLSLTAGLRRPTSMIIEDPGLNFVVYGRRPQTAALGVTSGLLSELTLIELEGIVAWGLVQVRRMVTLPATIAAGAFGIGARFAVSPARDGEADLAAVALTRYPPGLASALEKMEAKGTTVASARVALAPLWAADPRPGSPGGRGRLPLSERVEALREL
jgi:heat shock protein HtpX